MIPTPAMVAAFLGLPGDAGTVATATEHLPMVQTMVKAYTRDRGFDPDSGQPNDDVAAVIVSSCARLVANPSLTSLWQVGQMTIREGTFNGWTLPELAVLHRYRKRAG